MRAIGSGKFESIQACDLSVVSANICNEFLEYIEKEDKCQVRIENFFDYNDAKKFDYIVMGEVLEHVEEPERMLKKMKDLLDVGGKAFISTVINAPAIDHIHLFSDVSQVTQMIEDCRFEIIDYMTACIGDVSLEKAMERRDAVNIAMLVKRA